MLYSLIGLLVLVGLAMIHPATRLFIGRIVAVLGLFAWTGIQWVLTTAPWILVVVALAVSLGLAYAVAYGNVKILAIVCAAIALAAYALFKLSSMIFGKMWGAATAFVLFALAILGFLWPASIPVSPTAMAVLLVALPMADILWHVGSRPIIPGVPGSTGWIKWMARTAMMLCIVAAVVVITVTQVGWLNVGWNRVKYENQLTKNQSERQEGLQLIGQEAIDATDAEIYYWRQQQVLDSGLNPAHQQIIDWLLENRERQKAAVAAGEPQIPEVDVDLTGWFPNLDSVQWALLFVVLGLGVAILLPSSKSAPH